MRVEHIPDVNNNDNSVEPELLGAIGDVFGGSEAVECHGGVDWDGLQIDNIVDEEGEGVLEVIDEDRLVCLLGLRSDDDDQHGRPSEADAQASTEEDRTTRNRTADIDIDTTGAAIPVDYHVP